MANRTHTNILNYCSPTTHARRGLTILFEHYVHVSTFHSLYLMYAFGERPSGSICIHSTAHTDHPNMPLCVSSSEEGLSCAHRMPSKQT